MRTAVVVVSAIAASLAGLAVFVIFLAIRGASNHFTRYNAIYTAVQVRTEELAASSDAAAETRLLYEDWNNFATASSTWKLEASIAIIAAIVIVAIIGAVDAASNAVSVEWGIDVAVRYLTLNIVIAFVLFTAMRGTVAFYANHVIKPSLAPGSERRLENLTYFGTPPTVV